MRGEAPVISASVVKRLAQQDSSVGQLSLSSSLCLSLAAQLFASHLAVLSSSQSSQSSFVSISPDCLARAIAKVPAQPGMNKSNNRLDFLAPVLADFASSASSKAAFARRTASSSNRNRNAKKSAGSKPDSSAASAKPGADVASSAKSSSESALVAASKTSSASKNKRNRKDSSSAAASSVRSSSESASSASPKAPDKVSSMVVMLNGED